MPMKSWRVIFLLQFVCQCVCVCTFVNKCRSNPYTDFDVFFAKWLLIALTQTLLKLVTLGQRSRSQWRNTHFFLHNFLLTSLSCISALLFLIKWNSVWRLDIPLVELCFNFIKFEWEMTSFKFSSNNCPYLKFYWVRRSGAGVVSWTCDPVLALGQRFDSHSRRSFCCNPLG